MQGVIDAFLAVAAVGGDGGGENELWDIGQLRDQKVLWGARWFLVHVGEPQTFADLPVDEQLAPNHAVHRFVARLIATRRLRPSADYLVVRRPRLGIILSRHWPVFHALFMTTSATLAFPIKTAQHNGRRWRRSAR